MTKAHVTEQDKALISALLDGESKISDEALTKLDGDTLGRYSLIGDVMRGETAHSVPLDIADKIAAQLEHEPVHLDFAHAEIAKPQKPQNETGKVISLNWLRPVAQLAIAASVAVVAVVGVQTLPQGESSLQPGESEIPMLQTTPFAGVASPVSYSSEPALENANRGLRELQQRRIGALVLEHHRQTRLASTLAEEEIPADKKEQK